MHVTCHILGEHFDTSQALEFLDNSDLELSEDESPAAGDDQIYSENCHSSESVVSSSESDDNFSANDASTTSSHKEAQIPPSTSSNCGKRQRGRPRGRGVGSRARAKQAKPMLWKRNETFLPQQPVPEQNGSVQQSANDHEAHKSWKPVDYFNQYINDDVYEMLTDATNQTAVLQNGHSLKTSPDEIKKFIRINIVMGSLRYPRIRMY